MTRQASVRLSVALLVVILVLCIQPFIGAANADLFGSGVSSFEIEFVPIGQPGNPPDMTGQPRPAGSVPYEYRIGKYEISEEMIDKANALGGLALPRTPVAPTSRPRASRGSRRRGLSIGSTRAAGIRRLTSSWRSTAAPR